MSGYRENVIIENAKIFWKNFSGKESKYNRSGKRNFCVFIDDPDVADALANAGWNIRIMPPRDDDEPARKYMQVDVNFETGKRPPRITMIAGRKKTELDASSVACLDYAEIKNVDLIIRPYNWEVSGKMGVKAYLDRMYVTIVPDVFATKYSDLEYSEPF